MNEWAGAVHGWQKGLRKLFNTRFFGHWARAGSVYRTRRMGGEGMPPATAT